ncbi:sugar transferase [soil metagenome]
MPRRRATLWKSRWLSLIVMAADVAGLSMSWSGAYYVRRLLNGPLGPINDAGPYLAVQPLIVMAGIVNCFVFGLYMHRRRLASLNRPSILIRASYHWLLYIIVVAFFFKELNLGRAVITMAAFFGLIYLFASRELLRALKTHALRSGRGAVRSAIVGAGNLALEVRESLRNHPEIGFTLVGLITVEGAPLEPEMQASLSDHEIRILGTTTEINEIIDREGIEEVFLAVAHLDAREQFNLLNLADRRGVTVHVVSNIFGIITETAKVDEISTFPVVTLRDGSFPLHQAFMKRALDLACSLGGTFIWLLFLHWWIALKIKMDSPGPVFFAQDRIGRDGRKFRIIKYRTMRTDSEVYAVAPTDEADPRITRFGRWLRKTSLDELPQLLNVLAGDMSMVGPRPEMGFIVETYEAWQRRRLDVKPGLTGLWQVIGRKNLPLHLNMQYDFYYIKNQSFMLDLEILFRTVPAVLMGKGAF